MLERLKRIEGKRRTARVTVDDGDDEAYFHGYVLRLSAQLVVLHLLDYFHLDGFTILRCNDIREVRIGEFERAQDTMLRALGVAAQASAPAWLKHGSWPSALRSLQRRGKCIRVETVTPGRARCDLGVIVNADERGIELRSFDANAVWEAKPRAIAYESVSLVSFDDEYTRVYYEYIQCQ